MDFKPAEFRQRESFRSEALSGSVGVELYDGVHVGSLVDFGVVNLWFTHGKRHQGSAFSKSLQFCLMTKLLSQEFVKAWFM